MKHSLHFLVLIIIQFITITSQAQYVNINVNFKNWLSIHGYSACINGNQLDTTCSKVVNDTLLNLNNTFLVDISGIRYFDNLKTLQCNSANLTSLPVLPPLLEKLECNTNSLTSLPLLPSSLKSLYCYNNQLTAINGLPGGLKELSIGNNPLSSFPVLPSGLTLLICNNLNLTSLPALPSTLKNLYCQYNQLSTLPALPSGLVNIDLSYNNFSSLPSLPLTLQYLYCNNNQLTSLPALPAGLAYLICRSNQLSALPTLINSLLYIDCRNNQITSLPALPNTLSYLYCSNNQLSTLPSLSTSLLFLECRNNLLSSIPAIPGGLMSLNCGHNQLTALPIPPASLNTIYCDSNLITTIADLPDTMAILDIRNNTGITCLPPMLYIYNLYWDNTGLSCLSAPQIINATPSISGIPSCSTTVITGTLTSCTNQPLTLTATSGGTHQWYKNNIAIPGATTNTYTATTSGIYKCSRTTACATSTSGNANVTITQVAVPIVTPAPTVIFCPGDSVIASTTPVVGLSYVWYTGAVQVGTGPTYTVKGFANFHVKATDAAGCTAVSANTISSTPPVITPVISGNAVVCSGTSTTLSVTGNSPYQWYRNNILISGAINSSYTTSIGGSYTSSSFSCDTFTSAPFVLTSLTAPTVVITADSTSFCPGSYTTLRTNLSGNYIYQWYLNNNIITGATGPTYSPVSSGTFSVKVTHALNCFPQVTSNTVTISIFTPPNAIISTSSPSMSCSGSNLVLTANQGAGNSYTWYSGNGQQISGQTSSSYTANNNGNYYVKITDSNGCADTSEAVTVLLGLTTATISSTQTVFCSGTYYTLYANTNGVVNSYQWKNNGVPIPGKTSYFMSTFASPGNIYTVDITNECGTYTSAPYFDSSVVSPPSVLTASGPTGFCPPGSVTLNANTAPNYSYKWFKDYINAIVPGITTPSYTITSPGTYYVYVTDTLTGCGSVSAGVRVNNTGTNLILSPNTQNSYGACSSFVMTASAVPAGYTYEWVRNGVVVPGVNTQSYTTTTLSTPHQGISYDTYYVRAIGTCGTTTSNDVRLELKYQPLNPADVIIYPSTLVACDGESIGIGINRWVTDYYLQDVSIQWKLNGIAIPGATSNYYFATTSGNYSIDVTIPCGTTSSNVATLTFLPSPLAVITSNGTSLCGAGSSINLNVTTGSGNIYQWKNNNQILSGANSSSFTANNPGTYTCNVLASNGCKRTSNFINIFNGSNTSVALSGNNSFCRPSTGNIYTATLLSGANYSWTVPAGATITSGQGTNSITVSYASNASAGNISLNVTGNCGSSTILKPLVIRTSLPSAPGTITGVANGCDGESKLYKIRQVRGADSYLWIPPAGATINGSSSGFATTDTAVTVTFTSAFNGDTLRVKSINCKGSSAERKLRINHNPPAVPGIISGLTTGLCNQNNVIYSIVSVTNATSYTWTSTIPGITFNGNVAPFTTSSNSVSVSFGNFVNGRIQVNANNNCGSSGSRAMTVYARPAIPTIINGPTSVCDNQLGVVYSTSGVTNASAYNWTVPSGATVASGQNTTNITVNFGATPLTGNVRVRSQNVCASSSYRNLSVTVNNCPRVGDDGISEIKIQPNPFTESTTIILPDEVDASQCVLHVYDLFGRIVRSIKNPESNKLKFERADLSPGAYNLQLIYNKEQITTWIFVH